MEKIKQENGITVLNLVSIIAVILLFTGAGFMTKQTTEVLDLTEVSLEKYSVSVITEEIELAMGELQIDYYYDRYVNNNLEIEATFQEYIAQKLQNEGIKTSKGKVIGADETKVFYEDKNANKIAEGTFDEDTGEIVITTLVENDIAIQ